MWSPSEAWVRNVYDAMKPTRKVENGRVVVEGVSLIIVEPGVLLSTHSLKMQFSRLLPLALAGYASAMSLMDALAANNDQLSMLNGKLPPDLTYRNNVYWPTSNTSLEIVMKIPNSAQLMGMVKNVTIFAPSDNAIKQLMMEMPQMMQTGNKSGVGKLLAYHVAQGMVSSKDISSTAMFVPTVLGMNFKKANMSNNAMSGMMARAMDETAMASGTMGTMSAKKKLAGPQMVGVKMVDNMATVISGAMQMSNVTKADVQFDGGVLHIIDKVLTVPKPPSNTALDAGMTSLYGALKTANLIETVDSMPAGSTIFAPSNMAFEAVGSAVESVSPMDLMTVLKYHVVMGGMDMEPAFSTRLMSMLGMSGTTMTESMPGMNMRKRAMEMNLAQQQQMMGSLMTAQGGNVTVRMETNDLFVNSAKVVMADVITSNGVVHVIDK